MIRAKGFCCAHLELPLFAVYYGFCRAGRRESFNCAAASQRTWNKQQAASSLEID